MFSICDQTQHHSDTQGPIHCHSIRISVLLVYMRSITTDYHFYTTTRRLSCVYTLRLIGAISCPRECDLMVRPRKYSVIQLRPQGHL